MKAPAQATSPAQILGGGEDITGRQVQFWGQVWTVVGKNDYGDWDVVRHEQRETGMVKVTTQVAPELLPATHLKHARLLSTEDGSTQKFEYPK